MMIITLKLLSVLLFAVMLFCSTGCKACKRSHEPTTTIAGTPLLLETKKEEVAPKEDKGPKVKTIEIGPSKRTEEEISPEAATSTEPAVKPAEIANLPPQTYEETDLSARLREKMQNAYAGKDEAVPDVKIYLSEMNYDDFVSYYKKLGYTVHTVAVPASEVIGPVLEQRPELASKLKLSDYEGVVIHQVMIDEAGISAADRYIDPDTFKVVDKTFVTKTNK